MKLEINSPAPEFEGIIQTGKKISLSKYKGKWVILYFYPKDNTPGCTIEACNFRDDKERFAEVDAVIIGVSGDSIKAHSNFIMKHDLNFDLISDTEKTIIEQYGVWKEKSMCGKTFMGIERTTFIINPEGNIAEIFSKVKPAGHTDAVYARLLELQGKEA